MVINSFSDLVFYFLFFSFLGWFWETLLHLIRYRRLVNKGFLYGPYSPMYGIAGLVLVILRSALSIPFVPFLLISVASFLVYEYCGSIVLEKLTNIRWWNYRGRKLQIGGRVYLPNAVIYALIMTVCVFFGRPWTSFFEGILSPALIRLIGSGILLIIFVDQYFSLKLLSDFEERLKQWTALYHTLDPDEREFLRRLPEKPFGISLGDFPAELLGKIEGAAKRDHSGYRLLRAYPELELSGDDELARILRDILSMDREKRVKPALSRLKTMIRNFSEPEDKKYDPVLSEKLNIYKIFWIFFVSGIIGYVLETLFALITRGVLESRQGVIYGPFNQVYGIGAVLMVLGLKPLARKRDSIIFFGSALIGGAFEWVCSYVQEKVFNTVSWEYNESSFSIGSSGRTSLVFMLFWGILGVMLIQFILPRLLHFINRLLKKRGYTISIVLMVLIIIDLGISAAAVLRWSRRQDGLPASNSVELFLDEKYPNEFMAEIYPSMKKAGS
ncbi:putative ABC transporter permease [Treponema sp. OttesenSCG-928-L16]|nr:putative ABC transporter permease [Treponema sp. OttesenSCG-928-L16]